MVLACYPGSFNPFTIAHDAIVKAVRQQCQVDQLDLVISTVTLAKEHANAPTADERAQQLRELLSPHPWIGVVVTDRQTLADISVGYDWLVMGADKWTQIQEPRWYQTIEARDNALAQLPRLAIAPRSPHVVPAHATLLELPDPTLESVSSTAVRSGRTEWLAR